MNNPKNSKPNNKTPENIEVVIPAASLLDVMRRYKKITWPVTVTIRDYRRAGTLFFLRNRKDLEELRSRTEGLQVAYFRKVRNEMILDLAKDARVTVKYKLFRKPRNAALLSPREVIRYFLYRTGDLKEPEENAVKPSVK